MPNYESCQFNLVDNLPSSLGFIRLSFWQGDLHLVVLAFIRTIYIPLGNLTVFYWDDAHPFKKSYHLLFGQYTSFLGILSSFIWTIYICIKKYKTILTAYNRTTVPIHNTSLDAQHSKDEVTCSRPNLPGNSFLAENSGGLCRVLPMLALTCLVLDPSL